MVSTLVFDFLKDYYFLITSFLKWIETALDY